MCWGAITDLGCLHERTWPGGISLVDVYGGVLMLDYELHLEKDLLILSFLSFFLILVPLPIKVRKYGYWQ